MVHGLIWCVFDWLISSGHLAVYFLLCYSIYVMSDAANHSDKTPPPDKSTVILLFMIAADTTWRMFIPIIGGTILGVLADNSTVTGKPLGTIIGITIGIIIAAVLVRQQMNRKLTNGK